MAIYILTGEIAAGKSTYAKNAARTGYITVCDDAVVNAVHGGVYTCYDKKLKPLYKSTELHIAGMAVAMGRHVIIDRGVNISVLSRQRWVALARSLDVEAHAVVFPHDSPEEHAKRRYTADSRGLTYETWLKTAKAHAARYEVPTLAEGLTAVHFITFAEINRGIVF